MLTFEFGALHFTVTDEGRIALTRCFAYDNTDLLDSPEPQSICEFDFAGGILSGGTRLCGSDESLRLRYVRHEVRGDVLTVVSRSARVEVESAFCRYADTNAIRVVQKITNISGEPLCLEMANTLGICFGRDVVADHRNFYLHVFTNARYTEGMPVVRSLYDLGLWWHNALYQVENVGNASSNGYLPQGIVEDRANRSFLMFQIESYADWFYQISVSANRFNLQLGGPTARYHAWNRVLAPNESYTTVPVAVCAGETLNGVLAEMTHYRRHRKPDSAADAALPSIYNEYMHFSWDDPFAERVCAMAPYVQRSGCAYYVVDCGWHNAREISDMLGMYKKFGTWYEDRSRFPDGIRAVAEYVHSLGLKFGLWIAPEVVGLENTEMLAHYDDDCFFVRNGKKISSNTGYLLDFRHPKVRAYMTETIDRMIDEYGCDYIKFDGAPNPGFGTEIDATSPGDGLERHTEAFLDWAGEMMARHPQVIFEDCAAGGQRMDYRALSLFSLVSTSDQTAYNRYPYITANIFASVLPEQAAVWSYPVDSALYDPEHEEAVNALVSRERVVLNMINAILGRIHLASRIHLLDEEKQALIREGVTLYNSLTADKLQSVPYLPCGYTPFGATFAAVGLRTEEKIYLAVWNLGGERHVCIDLPEISVQEAKVIYPATLPTEFSFTADSLTLDFTEDEQARLFELTLN